MSRPEPLAPARDPSPLMTREQMRRYDALATERYGVPGIVLMENAGRGAADVILRLWRESPRRPREAPPAVGIVCGPGNNGGDGLVIARHLTHAGVPVRVALAASPDKMRGDAAANLAMVRAIGIAPADLGGDDAPQRLAGALAGCAILVDAVFGTGLDREVTGRMRALLEAMDALPMLRVAIDLPSGLDADTGRPLGCRVRADHTVTFGHLKVGLALHPGVELAGKVHLVPIGAPADLAEVVGFDARLTAAAAVAARLPPRPVDGHKGTFGHLLVLAGSPGKSGAAVMAAMGGVRSGAGLVTLAVPEDARASIEARVLEVMVEAIVPGKGATPDEGFDGRWDALCAGKTAVVVGPGCGTDPGTVEAIRRVVRRTPLPTAIDADGLNALAGRLDLLRDAAGPRVLTPHPGEMARLIGCGTAEVQADRIAVARRFAAEHRVTLVLKGARTVVAVPDGPAWINPTGNPGLASGGSGDVLAGILGGLLAQGSAPADAAVAAAFVHGAAADRIAGDSDGRGLAARDLLEALPPVLRDLLAHSTIPC